MSEAPGPMADDEIRFRMGELKSHNDLLGDRAALDEAWETDGYWFFKDVLDKEAVGSLRQEFVSELLIQGVVNDPGAASTEKSVPYNGASLERYPRRMDPLAEKAPWRSFVAEASINSFFTRLLGDEPFWVPIAEYRATPPGDARQPLYDGIHQDGPTNVGIPFRICWIPLAEIDAQTGGVALLEGMTDKVIQPISNGSYTHIPPDDIPTERLRRTTYEAGDVLLMNLMTPHSGLANRSRRFRLSIDLRVMARSDACPIVGEVIAITPGHIRIRDERGETGLKLTPETYVRDLYGKRVAPENMVDVFSRGSQAIVAHRDGAATVLRPPH